MNVGDEAELDLPGFVEATRRYGTTLVAAMAMKDGLATQLAATHLDLAVDRVEAASHKLDPDLPPHSIADAVAVLEAFRTSHEVAPRGRVDWSRLLRWFKWRSSDAAVAERRPDLFETEARGLDLAHIDVERLYLVECGFSECSLPYSLFDHAVLEDCDLQRARVAGASLRGAVFLRCSFAGADLTDACFDEAMFVDCDLRAADLGVTADGQPASALRTSFIRCDLRETQWTSRLLVGARFQDCRMFGAHGTPILRGVEIDRPDLSMEGDGSGIGEARTVLTKWGVLGWGQLSS